MPSKKRAKSRVVLFFAALLILASPAFATANTLINWELSGTANGGSDTIDGTFTYDVTTSSITTYNINVDSSLLGIDGTYDLADSTVNTPPPTGPLSIYAQISSLDGNNISLYPDSPGSFAVPADDQFYAYFGTSQTPGNYEMFTGTTLDPVATPEPCTLLLVVSGLLGFAALRRI